jgi:thioredoxin reductase (NADPH)
MGSDHEVAIIGAGAAGMAAGIYCGRSGVSSVIFDSKAAGGLTMTSPEIENYPGFPKVSGPELIERFKEHASKWCEVREAEGVNDIRPRDDGVTVRTTDGTYEVGAVILTMGTEHRNLGVPGEKEFAGKGVSYCATCDGFFYSGKKVAQVGGGNTAALEAIYLKGLDMDVRIIHRRDVLRAEQDYRKRIEDTNIPVMFDTVVKEIIGDRTVKALVLENVRTKEVREEPFDGVFIAIGILPTNGLAKQMGVELDANGYIKVDPRQKTNIDRVFAAGDITGGVRQIVTACSEGAIAALSTLDVLGKAYPF